MNNSRKILVTGAAGFIGFHFAERELKKGNIVIGVDNLNNYYDKKIKTCRLKILKKYRNFIFFKTSLLDEKFYKVLKRHYSDIYCIIHFFNQILLSLCYLVFRIWYIYPFPTTKWIKSSLRICLLSGRG